MSPLVRAAVVVATSGVVACGALVDADFDGWKRAKGNATTTAPTEPDAGEDAQAGDAGAVACSPIPGPTTCAFQCAAAATTCAPECLGGIAGFVSKGPSCQAPSAPVATCDEEVEVAIGASLACCCRE